MTSLDDMHAGRQREAATRQADIQAAFNAELARCQAHTLSKEKRVRDVVFGIVIVASALALVLFGFVLAASGALPL